MSTFPKGCDDRRYDDHWNLKIIDKLAFLCREKWHVKYFTNTDLVGSDIQASSGVPMWSQGFLERRLEDEVAYTVSGKLKYWNARDTLSINSGETAEELLELNKESRKDGFSSVDMI